MIRVRIRFFVVKVRVRVSVRAYNAQSYWVS